MSAAARTKAFFGSIWAVLRTVLFAWLLWLVRFLAAFWAWLLRLLGENREDERQRKAAKTRCVPIQDPAYVRPDPLIYSQRYLAEHGLNYSWDNPDIKLFLGTTPVNAHELAPSTTYEVVVRVWNGSMDCPLVMMPVHLSYLSFGVGTVSHAIATAPVDVGVKGGVNNPAFVTIPWTTPAAPGHYCLQALLDPHEDLDFTNNLGQHNTDVAAAQSPATFSFALRNDTHLERTYWFTTDSYVLGDPVPCDDERAKRSAEERHHNEAPLPPGWTVEVAPATPTLPPDAEISVVARVTPPDGFTGKQTINVHTHYREYHEDHLAGGVTITVTA
jgi:hypothetical protein